MFWVITFKTLAFTQVRYRASRTTERFLFFTASYLKCCDSDADLAFVRLVSVNLSKIKKIHFEKI